MNPTGIFVDKLQGKIYYILHYGIPPVKLMDSYTKAKRIELDDYKILLEGIVNGSIRPINMIMMDVMLNGIHRNIGYTEKNLESFEQTGKFTDDFLQLMAQAGVKVPKMGRQDMFNDLNRSLRGMRESVTSIETSRTNMIRQIPGIQRDLEKIINSPPEFFTSLRVMQYSGIVILAGEAIPSLDMLMKGATPEMIVYAPVMTRTILRWFLKFYLETYTIRMADVYHVTEKSIKLEDIIVATNSSMNIVTDLFCPKLLLTRNTESALVPKVDIVLKNNSIVLGYQGKEYSEIQLPGMSPEDVFTVEPAPEHAQRTRTPLWLRESSMLVRVLLELTLREHYSKHDSSLFASIDTLYEHIQIILEEGITINEETKIVDLIKGSFDAHGVVLDRPIETSSFVVTMLRIIFSGGEDFSVEVRQILEELERVED